MNPYNFSVLFFSFNSLFVGILVWLKRRDSLAMIYFFFSLAASIWGIGYAVMISPNISYPTALLATRLSQAISMFIPITWLHFILFLTGNQLQWRRVLVVFYLVGILICFFGLSSWFIPHLKPAVGFKYYTRPGPLYHVYPLFYFSVVPIGYILFAKKIRELKSEEKLQLRGLFFATLIGFVGGSFCFFPVYEMMVPQYGLFIMPVYPFVLAYFMIRYRLFDLEQAIQAFQREKLATIGLLAASVNHEIRNPLYAARGVLENYLESYKDGGAQKEPNIVSEKALKQIDRALEVITKLNRFAKPSEETKDPRQRTQANIQEALKNVLDLVSYEFSLDKIKINNQIPIDLPPIQTDQRQLEEILFNLIVNACHAMEGGGELVIAGEAPAKIRGGSATLSGGKQSQCHPEPNKSLSFPRKRESINVDPRLKHSGMTGSKVKITIQDTGTGIAPEQAKHLFEPFHTTKGENGTGLGLYITKQLVERNGGKISVKSEERKGTSFVLEFQTK